MKKSAGLSLSLLLLAQPLSAKGLEDLVKFFSARAQVIKVENNTAVADKGLPVFRPGFPVAVYTGTEVENPLTHRVEFVITDRTGRGEVFKSFPNYSVIKLRENRGVKRGNVVELDYKNICFIGSDAAFSKLQDKLPVEKVSDTSGCRWVVKETPTGFAVLLNNRQVFFAEKNLPSYALPSVGADISGVNILVKPVELAQYNQIPTSIDAVSVGKTGYTAVSFEDGILLYQIVGGDVVPLARIPTPGGKIVNTQIFQLNGQIFVVGNAITSDGEPSSFVATLVGTNPVIIRENIPYLLAVLDKSRPSETFVAQSFDGSFGPVYAVKFDGRTLKVGQKVDYPAGIRITSATLTESGNLAFIDGEGNLKIYKKTPGGFKPEASVAGDFGKSYTSVSLPVFKGGGVIFFPPRPVPVTLFGAGGFLVAQNEPKRISSVIVSGTLKFTGGKLYFVAPSPDGTYLKKPLAGYTFRDTVQGLAIDGNGTPFAVSGYRNPLLFTKSGKLYRLEFKYF